jgi:hypothetical protein
LAQQLNHGLSPGTTRPDGSIDTAGTLGGTDQSVGQQLYANVGQAAALDPRYNNALTSAGTSANNAASGATGAAVTAQASGTINQAGAANAAVAPTLGSQAADLGIVRNSALGTGPSAAEALAKSQLDNNVRSQAALAATARGGNIAAAMRGAANSGTQQSLQTSQQIAAQRAQEQLNAQTLLTSGANNLTGATQANANQAGTLSGQQVALAATKAGLVGQGMQGQQAVASQFGNQTAQQVQAGQTAKDQWANFLQNQYQLSLGMPATTAAPQASIINTNTQASQADTGSYLKMLGSVAAAL